jgi:hypothetical protein
MRAEQSRGDEDAKSTKRLSAGHDGRGPARKWIIERMVGVGESSDRKAFYLRLEGDFDIPVGDRSDVAFTFKIVAKNDERKLARNSSGRTE